jgi:hypothetical protein
MTVKTFSELFLPQPPASTFTPASGAATTHRNAPSLRFTAPTALIPSSLTSSTQIQPLREDGLWYWEIAVELREILSCPCCGGFWDNRPLAKVFRGRMKGCPFFDFPNNCQIRRCGSTRGARSVYHGSDRLIPKI